MSSELPSGFKTREEYNEYMRKYNQRYRKQKRAKSELVPDTLTENFEKAMEQLKAELDEKNKLKEALQPQLRNIEDTKLALSLFHKAHSIARDRSLSDSEAREQIINFRFEAPPDFFDILNKFEETKSKMEMKKNE